MSLELEERKRHLKSLEDFLASPAHTAYKVAIEKEIYDTQLAIIAITPDSLRDFVQECQLRGELRLLENEFRRFEDARVSLKARIDEMAEAELQNATQQKR
jgi:hypothetical protein